MNKYKEFIEGISQITEKNFLKDGYLAPIVFFMKNQSMIPMLVKFKDDKEKYLNYKNVGITAKQIMAEAIILVNDIALRKCKDKKDIAYILENYDTECPLSYPENMREDGIFFTVIDLKSQEITGYFQRYEKKDETFYFHKLIPHTEFDKTKQCKLGGDLQAIVLEGYNEKLIKEGGFEIGI